MLNRTLLHPWNYTLPDLKNFMNDTRLPPVHDLLGISTTTTTEIVNVNKPIFPLNLTFWSSITSSWRSNYTSYPLRESPPSSSNGFSSVSSSSYSDSGMEEPFTDEVLDQTKPDLTDYHHQGPSSRDFTHQEIIRRQGLQGTREGVARMVIPASLDNMIHQSTPSTSAINLSFINQDTVGWLMFDNSTVLTGGSAFDNMSRMTGNATYADSEGGTAAMSTAGMVVTSVILGIMILTTVIGNVFVIAAILLERNLQQVANFLIVSLAVADLMVACLVMPLGAVYEISREWVLGPELCDMWTSSDVLCCTASILHLVAIALDRYWAVTHVDYIQTRRNGKRIGIMILFIWMTAVVVSMAPFFGWKDPDYLLRVNEQKKCLVSQDLTYQIFATLATFYVPLTAILILYWKIFQTARKRLHARPGRSGVPRKLSLRKKSKDKKKKKSEPKSSRSNGIVQQVTTAFTTESSNKLSPSEYSGHENTPLATAVDNGSAASDVVQSTSVACITGNLVTLNQQNYTIPSHSSQHQTMLHQSSYSTPGGTGAADECVILPRVIQSQQIVNSSVGGGSCGSVVSHVGGGGVVVDSSFIKASALEHHQQQQQHYQPHLQTDNSSGSLSAVMPSSTTCHVASDVQCRPLLHCNDGVMPPLEYREDTYILRQNFYGEGGGMNGEPTYRTSSITIYPTQPIAVSSEQMPLFPQQHDSANANARSLYKHESTNTDSIYDFQVSNNFDNLPPNYARKQFDEGNTTTTTPDSTYIIEPSPRSLLYKTDSAAQDTLSSYQQTCDINIQTDINAFQSITPAISESQLPSDTYDDKISSSAPPSKSSQEEEESPAAETAGKPKKSGPASLAPKNIAASSVTSLASTTITKTGGRGSGQSHQQKKTKKESLDAKREKKAAKTLAIITGAFVVCWLPFFVIALLMPVCPSCWMSDIMFSFFLWLGYFNSTLNPIIYTIFSPEFREAFKRMLCGRKTQRYRPGKYR